MERHVTKLVAATLVLVSAHLWAAEDISFRLARKHFVIVPVLVNGQGPYDFLLDTGSTTSVVDRKLAKELGLKPLQETVIRTASGTERVPIARVHRIDVGSHSTQTVLVLCSKMDGIRSLDKNIRGILRFNFLSRFRYTLDYKGKTLRFEDAGAREGTRVPFDASGRSIVLATDGLRLLLDTGAHQRIPVQCRRARYRDESSGDSACDNQQRQQRQQRPPRHQIGLAPPPRHRRRIVRARTGDAGTANGPRGKS